MTYLSAGSKWTFELIRHYDQSIAQITVNFGPGTYPSQIETITAEQILDTYASSGLLLGYNHWSYGKYFLASKRSYQRGPMGLAYKTIINSNPCVAYPMEENTMPMQALTVAHACYDHDSPLRGNYLFRMQTNADAIINYLLFAKSYVARCEQRYGEQEMELPLDPYHALQNYGVDRYRQPKKLSISEEQVHQAEHEEYLEVQVNDLWRILSTYRAHTFATASDIPELDPQFLPEPGGNLLYFIEKSTPKS